jgi:hypothetical protein
MASFPARRDPPPLRHQVSAALQTLRALAATIGPPLAARAYVYGQSIGNPGLAYWFIAAVRRKRVLLPLCPAPLYPLVLPCRNSFSGFGTGRRPSGG